MCLWFAERTSSVLVSCVLFWLCYSFAYTNTCGARSRNDVTKTERRERERTVLRGIWTSFKFNWHSVPNVFGFVVDGVFKLILYAVLWLYLWYRCALSILLHKNRTSNFSMCEPATGMLKQNIKYKKYHSTKTMKLPFDKSAKTIRANAYVPEREKKLRSTRTNLIIYRLWNNSSVYDAHKNPSLSSILSFPFYCLHSMGICMSLDRCYSVNSYVTNAYVIGEARLGGRRWIALFQHISSTKPHSVIERRAQGHCFPQIKL